MAWFGEGKLGKPKKMFGNETVQYIYIPGTHLSFVMGVGPSKNKAFHNQKGHLGSRYVLFLSLFYNDWYIWYTMDVWEIYNRLIMMCGNDINPLMPEISSMRTLCQRAAKGVAELPLGVCVLETQRTLFLKKKWQQKDLNKGNNFEQGEG